MSATAVQPETHGSPRRSPLDIGTADSGALFRRWSQFHDERARGALVERFLPLARSLARRYASSSVPIEDLVQVASLGLVKAIDRFDADRRIAFSTFAVPTILGELKRYFRDFGWSVHVPRGAQERARHVEAAAQLLAGETGRSPTAHELARYLTLSVEEVLDGIETAQAYAAASLDAPCAAADGPSESFVEMIATDDHDLALVDASVTVGAALVQLPPRERAIMHLRFVEDLTQSQIGERIGISQMQVSRLLRSSLQRLRDLTEDAASSELLER